MLASSPSRSGYPVPVWKDYRFPRAFRILYRSKSPRVRFRGLTPWSCFLPVHKPPTRLLLSLSSPVSYYTVTLTSDLMVCSYTFIDGYWSLLICFTTSPVLWSSFPLSQTSIQPIHPHGRRRIRSFSVGYIPQWDLLSLPKLLDTRQLVPLGRLLTGLIPPRPMLDITR